MAEELPWEKVFKVQVVEEGEEKNRRFRIERRPWNGGVEIIVTPLEGKYKNVRWGVALTRDEYQRVKRVLAFLDRIDVPEELKLLYLIGFLNQEGIPSPTASILSALTGKKPSTVSVMLSHLRRKGLIEPKRHWRRVTLKRTIEPLELRRE